MIKPKIYLYVYTYITYECASTLYSQPSIHKLDVLCEGPVDPQVRPWPFCGGQGSTRVERGPNSYMSQRASRAPLGASPWPSPPGSRPPAPLRWCRGTGTVSRCVPTNVSVFVLTMTFCWRWCSCHRRRHKILILKLLYFKF